jgi:hypothetical protein
VIGLPIDSQRGLPANLRHEVAASLRGQSLGVMLYGSQARRSAQMDSDVDVLQLVISGSGTYKNGRVAVTAYTPAHLHQMASQGSLFILHLIVDGIVVSDPRAILRRALDAYVPPASYDSLRSSLREAAAALLNRDADLDEHREQIGRLGIYLLRTELYARSAALGNPVFDAERAAGSEDSDLLRVLKMRRVERLNEPDVSAIQAKLSDIFQVVPRDELLSDAAVRLALVNPHAAGLIAQALSQSMTMDYNAFPLPPL